MRFAFDFSVTIAGSKAAGSVTGRLDFPFAPGIGDVVVFPLSAQSVTPHPAALPRVLTQLSVTKRFAPAAGAGIEPMIALEDVTVADEAEAVSLFAYLEQGLGFDVDSYL